MRLGFPIGWRAAAVALVFVAVAAGQGETTSAIAGQVSDQSGAALPAARVVAVNDETALARTVQTDGSGRFTFLQLKPGSYTIEVTASGFETQKKASVAAALGQTQVVNFVLKVLAAHEDVVVGAEPPLINTDNPNTATTLNAKASRTCRIRVRDLTYPAQFAPGALINTAGSSNDFVGGSERLWQRPVQRLAGPSNAYIVDGLETNDPLTNLNSGLSTNLVLGLNSIAEVTVNTTSYAVDQGRYGASQVNYVTKSRRRTPSTAICTSFGTARI